MLYIYCNIHIYFWAPVGTGKCPFRGPTSTPKDIWNTWYHWRRWMCLDGKINQASHLIGASTFLCVISRRCHLHAAPARVDGTILLTGQIWYYLNGFRIFVQMIHRIISRWGVAKVRRAWDRSPGPQNVSLLYTFRHRHDTTSTT